ncbi:hypothetical protein D1007_14192 [Hordeum vulgare]|nr:hypothetical protein D1007_14192 [Hordeum vulgare]
MRLLARDRTNDELDRALGALLGSCPEDLSGGIKPLYAYDYVEEMVAEMPAFDEWGLVRPHKDSPITVSSSCKDSSDHDSKATEGEEDADQIPPPRPPSVLTQP